jgi:peptidoglycan hydrolase-like protein with peptidoglycan-binding domain
VPKKPTLRRGSKGEAVKELQTELIKRGYDLGSYGADGSFGKATEAAVKAFQKDRGLTADGICGEKTWEALETPDVELYTVTIPHLAKHHAEALVSNYAGATMEKE